jgi:hypothetical protein
MNEEEDKKPTVKIYLKKKGKMGEHTPEFTAFEVRTALKKKGYTEKAKKFYKEFVSSADYYKEYIFFGEVHRLASKYCNLEFYADYIRFAQEYDEQTREGREYYLDHMYEQQGNFFE